MGAIISSEDKERMLPFINANFGKISEREMARRLGIGKTAVNRWRAELGLKIKKHTVNEDFFKIWSPDMAYVLGFIFADGNINWKPEKSYRALTITTAERDKEHLERIRSKLKSTKPLLYSESTKSYRLIVNNITICTDLMNLGVIPRKSLSVKFPEIPEDMLSYFIKGVIDGDGTIRYVSRKRSPYFEIRIASGSEQFLKTMTEKIELKTGITGQVKNVRNNLFILRYTCRKALNLAEWIYNDGQLHLTRKSQQYSLALEAGGGDTSL